MYVLDVLITFIGHMWADCNGTFPSLSLSLSRSPWQACGRFLYAVKCCWTCGRISVWRTQVRVWSSWKWEFSNKVQVPQNCAEARSSLRNENSVIIYSTSRRWKVGMKVMMSGASQQNSVTALSWTTEEMCNKLKCLPTACHRNPSLCKPWDVLRWNLHCSSKAKLVSVHPVWRARPHVEHVNKVFSCQFEISGLEGTCVETFYGCFWLFFCRTLHHCSAVKLQKCFVDN